MRIAFVSTRGIPNNYGGFEEFAEYISVGLAERGHEIIVYSPHFHPYKQDTYKGVKIKHIYSPEHWMGSSIGSFFYDFFSLRDALKKQHCDIIYEAGYTSIIPAYIWYNVKKLKTPIVTTNMDGLENKRSKFNLLTRAFLSWEEKKAVRHSHHLISDNLGIQDYYKQKYGKESTYLAYGADIHDNYNAEYLKEYGLEPNNYHLLIARLEPENNVAMAIDGYLKSNEKGKRPLVVVGKTTTPHGLFLVQRYRDKNVKFLGGIFDFDKLNSIRHFSYAYFHGHSIGGTNPSLLEAMAADCFILAHDNIFNRAVLDDSALYYKKSDNVAELLNDIDNLKNQHSEAFEKNNLEKIKSEYSWEALVDKHEEYFNKLMEQKR